MARRMTTSSRAKVADQASGEGWTLVHGDCIAVARGLPDNSLHYAIYSPPFESLYTFSDDPRDLSNCRDSATFWTHYRFLIGEMFRAMMPGRNVSVHCMPLPLSKLRDGVMGLRDFPGEIIRAHQEAGFVYHSQVCIRKDPVAAMQRTKSHGLLHKNVVADSAISRMGLCDYIVTLTKPGRNPEPVKGVLATYHGDDQTDASLTEAAELSYRSDGKRTFAEHKSILIWQRYAEPVWMDIAQSDVLSNRLARDQADERHISPLQLTAIRRCVQLWSNPGDVVFSPFAGIGSEIYVAVEEGRRGFGVELKASYHTQSVRNLQSLERRSVGLAMTDAAADLQKEAAE